MGEDPAQLRQLVAGRLLDLAERPYVLINERELSVLRRGLIKPGWKSSVYRAEHEQRGNVLGPPSGLGLRQFAASALQKDIAIPDRAGHFHHLFCDDGVRLDPMPDGRFVCRACGREYTGERYEAAARHLEHNLLARYALALAIVYGIERDKLFARKSAEIILKYARAYPGPHTSPTEGGIFYQSLDESVWIIPLAQAYDLIYDSNELSDHEKVEIEDKLFRAAALGLAAQGIDGNWGSWHLSAVGVVGLTTRSADLLSYAIESFAKQLTDQLGEDGLWPESVHTYHFYALRAFVALAEGCSRIGLNLFDWVPAPGKCLAAMFRAPVSYAYPTFQIPAINDGWWRSALPLDLYEIAHRRWDDPLFGWVLKTGYGFGARPACSFHRECRSLFERNSLYALLFGRDLPGRLAPPDLVSAHFPGLGTCVLRAGDEAFLTFDYGPFLGHGHLDKMSITFAAHGQVLVPDYGTPGYGSKIMPWFVGTPAHNTIVVDGRSQEPNLERGLLRFSPGRELQIVEAETLEAYPGVRHFRRVAMVGPAVVVEDIINSDEPHRYDINMRFDGSLELSEAGMERADAAALAGDYEYVTFSEAFSCPSGWKAIVEGDAGVWLAVFGFHDGGALLAVGDAPASDGASLCQAITSRQVSDNCSFVTILYPSTTHAGARDFDSAVSEGFVSASEGSVAARYVVMRREHLEDHLVLVERRSPKPSSASAALSICTDAEAALVRLCDGRPAFCALISGSFLEWKGDRLCESSARIDRLEVDLRGRYPLIRCQTDQDCSLALKSPCRFVKLHGERTTGRIHNGMTVVDLRAK